MNPISAAASSTPDTNMVIAGLLNDLAVVQDSKQREFGYKQASSAIRWLDEPVEDLRLPDGTLRRIPRIGPASTRVILEVLETGASPTVERAVALSPRAQEVTKRRRLRAHFYSRAGVRRALADSELGGPLWSEYRGDLQMHSTWSDGSQSLEEIVETGIARGCAFAAVTDHAGGLAIANGLSPERFARQRAEIDALNRGSADGFRLLKGVEANISADGRLDVDAEAIRQFDVVLAAPHSKLRVADDQTARLLAVLRIPGVHILAHPRGRMSAASPASPRIGRRCSPKLLRAASPSRSTAIRRARISTACWREKPSTQAACSLSTATPTAHANGGMRRPPWRTRGWQACHPTA